MTFTLTVINLKLKIKLMATTTNNVNLNNGDNLSVTNTNNLAPENTITTTSVSQEDGRQTSNHQETGGNGFERILWFAAGADATILQRCPHSDRVKYQGLGGIVWATGILAFIAMTFGISVIFFKNEPVSFKSVAVPMLIGLIWGAIIFNLDRFIISSTGKGDGSEKITLSELINALPRILMACVIALSISAPLEIKLFDDEITKFFQKENEGLILEQEKAYENGAKNEIDAIQAEINLKEKEKVEQEQIRSKNEEFVQFEIAHGGCKGKCQEYKMLMATAEKKIDQLQEEINRLTTKIDKFNNIRDAKLKDYEGKIKAPPGLLDRLLLLERLPDSKWPVWIVRALFFVIEVGPLFFKMMLTRSVYDHLKHNEDELVLARQNIFEDTKIDPSADAGITEKFYVYGDSFLMQQQAKMNVDEQKRIDNMVLQRWQEYLTNQIANHPEQFAANTVPTEEGKPDDVQTEPVLVPPVIQTEPVSGSPVIQTEPVLVPPVIQTDVVSKITEDNSLPPLNEIPPIEI
jgi:hypothetical protein